MEIYTDGSSMPVDEEYRGGIGVFSEQLNISLSRRVTYQVGKETNNLAELEAMLCAIYLAITVQPDVDKIIYTDSRYVLDTVTKWMYNWEAQGWLRPRGQPVENLATIKLIHKLLTTYDNKITFAKVPAHAGVYGNEEADKLAKAGCLSTKRSELLTKWYNSYT